MSTSQVEVADLYLRERGRLGRIGAAITQDPREGEEIAQDVFLRLLSSRVRPESEGLLVRMARNLAIDRLRRRRRREAARPLVDAGVEAAPPGADAALAAREDLRDLVRLLATMPDRRRRVFLMSRLDGVPQSEIARSLGVSLSTVEKDLRAALDLCLAWRRAREAA